MKAKLPSVTLICVDTTDKAHLAVRAIEKSLEQCEFGAVKLLTHEQNCKYAVQIDRLDGIEAYSNFVIRQLHNFVDTKHCLIVQADGYVINGPAWRDEFLQFDYIGAPWRKWQIVGNGGFSLRSRRMLKFTSQYCPEENAHPEDAWICFKNRGGLEKLGIKFAPFLIAEAFAFEGREFDVGVWTGTKYAIENTFGFHSWLTPLADHIEKPLIFHHSGDAGDVVYSLATVAALGGGVFYLSPDNKHPWPKGTRERPSPGWAGNLLQLIRHQPYIWAADYTEEMPVNTTVDLNRFREFYRTGGADNWTSLFRLHLKTFGVDYPENRPWLYASPVATRPIVVSRSHRYRTEWFPWERLINQYGKDMIFVGTGEEYFNFMGLVKVPVRIPRIETPTLYDVAQVIAGAKVFIGNQSAPMAIALGLNKPVLQEIWHERVAENKWRGNPNCIFKRDNLIWEQTLLEQQDPIPNHWLK